MWSALHPSPPTARRAAAFVVLIYLGGLVVPPLGSVAAWIVGRRAYGAPGLTVHLAHALQIQLVALGVLAAVQAGVVTIGWAIAPVATHLTWVPTLVFAGDVALSVAVWAGAVLFAPLGLLGEALRRPLGPALAPERRTRGSKRAVLWSPRPDAAHVRTPSLPAAPAPARVTPTMSLSVYPIAPPRADASTRRLATVPRPAPEPRRTAEIRIPVPVASESA